MKLLGRYQGRNGKIEIVECSWDGTRVYFEEGVRQSQATPDGESVFTYVKLMDELLRVEQHTRPGVRWRKSCDKAVASRKKTDDCRHQPDQLRARAEVF